MAISFNKLIVRTYEYMRRSNLLLGTAKYPQKVHVLDTNGHQNTIGIFGEQLATDIINDVLAQFSYGISDRELKAAEIVSTGTVTIEDTNLLTVSSGTAADGAAGIESFSTIRYRPAHTAIANFTALFTNPTAVDCDQWIGVNDAVNGFAIGFYNGVLNVKYIRNGVHTHIPYTDFNGGLNINNIDFTKLNLFRITYGYLGVAPVAFEIMMPNDDSYKPLHTLRLQGAIAQTHIELPYLPVRMDVVNTGNTTDVKIKSGSWQGGTFGFCRTCGSRPFSFPQSVGHNSKVITTGDTPILLAAFNNVSTFQTFANKIRAKLDLFTFLPFDPDNDCYITIQLVGGITTTTPSWVDIDATNSVIQYDDTATVFTGGNVGLTLFAFTSAAQGNNSPQSTPVELPSLDLGLFSDPGTEFGIVATVTNLSGSATVNTTILWSVNWSELF
jgi:hypothetical protein